MSASKPRVSAIIVGAGLMGRWHAHAIHHCGGAVKAVVDADTSRATALAARYDGAQAFSTIEEACAGAHPAFVHVCTAPLSHVAQAKVALENRCHVIVEKPVAPTAAETRELVNLALVQKRWVVPVHQFPFQHGVLSLRRQRDVLGDVLHLEIQLASAGADGQTLDASSIATDILTHCLALTGSVLDQSLPLVGWSASAHREGELRVAGLVGSTSVHFLVSMSTRPTFAEMRVLGTRASAFVDLFHGYSVVDASEVSRASKAARPFRSAVKSLGAASTNIARRSLHSESAYPGLNELVRQTYLANERGTVPPISFAELQNVADLRDILVRAASATEPRS